MWPDLREQTGILKQPIMGSRQTCLPRRGKKERSTARATQRHLTLLKIYLIEAVVMEKFKLKTYGADRRNAHTFLLSSARFSQESVGKVEIQNHKPRLFRAQPWRELGADGEDPVHKQTWREKWELKAPLDRLPCGRQTRFPGLTWYTSFRGDFGLLEQIQLSAYHVPYRGTAVSTTEENTAWNCFTKATCQPREKQPIVWCFM